MAIAYVNSQVYGSNSSLSPITFNGVTAGNAIIVLYTAGSYASDITVSDDKGNSYNFDKTGSSPETYYKIFASYSKISTGGDIQLSFSGTVRTVVVYEISGIGNITIDKKSTLNVNSNDSSKTSGNTATTLYGDELLVGALSLNMFSGFTNTSSVGSGYSNFLKDTNDNNDIAISSEIKVVSTTGQYSATFGITGGYQGTASIFTFYGTPSSITGVQSITGVGSITL